MNTANDTYLRKLLLLTTLLLGFSVVLFSPTDRELKEITLFELAAVGTTPRNVALTNNFGTTAAISWSTATPTTGAVKYKKTDETEYSTQGDVRGNVQSTTHYIVLENLTPNTDYHIAIISGGQDFWGGGEINSLIELQGDIPFMHARISDTGNPATPFTFKTLDTPNHQFDCDVDGDGSISQDESDRYCPFPVYGFIHADGAEKAGSVIVYVKLVNTASGDRTSTFMSYLTRAGEGWVVDKRKDKKLQGDASTPNYFKWGQRFTESEKLYIIADGGDKGYYQTPSEQTADLLDIKLTDSTDPNSVENTGYVQTIALEEPVIDTETQFSVTNLGFNSLAADINNNINVDITIQTPQSDKWRDENNLVYHIVNLEVKPSPNDSRLGQITFSVPPGVLNAGEYKIFIKGDVYTSINKNFTYNNEPNIQLSMENLIQYPGDVVNWDNDTINISDVAAVREEFVKDYSVIGDLNKDGVNNITDVGIIAEVYNLFYTGN